jgi:hypothetical protein
MKCGYCNQEFAIGEVVILNVTGLAGVSPVSGNPTLVEEEDAVFLHGDCVVSFLMSEMGGNDAISEVIYDEAYSTALEEVKALLLGELRERLGAAHATEIFKGMEDDGVF